MSPLLHLLADLDDRLLVQAGSLVQADVLAQLVDVVVIDDHPGRVDVGDRAVLQGLDDHARVDGDRTLEPGGDDGRLGHRASGTAWRCMFEPMSARLASSCSRNGIKPAETPTICLGEISMNWIWSTATVTKSVWYRAVERRDP